MSSAAGLSDAEMQYAINHVFLPPKLPQNGDDEQAMANEMSLLRMVCSAFDSFRAHVPPGAVTAVDEAQGAICQLCNQRDENGDVEAKKLQSMFRTLCEKDEFIPIHVQAQNSAITAKRDGDSVLFEFFELSPTNAAAMSTQGRLQRQFPGSAVSIPLIVFDDENLHSAIVDAICKMSHQEVIEMKPKVKKAGEWHIEERDTTDPSIVTDLLATTLSSLGETTLVPTLVKNTREQVCWKDAKMPWRRSPLWLLVRVTTQTIMSRANEETLYKEFMGFLMASILKATEALHVSSEVLYCMVAKISRRLQKLGRDNQYSWLESVGNVLTNTTSRIQADWKKINRDSDSELQFEPVSAAWLQWDRYGYYPALQDFIQSIGSRQTIVASATFCPPWSVPKWASLNLPNLAFSQHDESATFGLLAFERWVAVSLDSWLKCNMDATDTPDKLLSLMRSYHEASLPCYSKDPNAISLMVLTIMELWVACDRSASNQNALLLDYDHEIPGELLQSLILPFKIDMERLYRVETYLKDRHDRALQEQTPSIFTSFGNLRSFGVRFFASSKYHQNLMQKVEGEAERARERKRTEFIQKQESYRSHMAKHATLAHEYYEKVNQRTGVVYLEESSLCQSCYHRKAAESQNIVVHEWPLPKMTHQAHNVVFEMQVPDSFRGWRDATAHVIMAVLQSSSSTEARPEDYLANYFAYNPGWTKSSGRFVLASTTKSNRRTHRKAKRLATASESDILVKNGLTFRYYDNTTQSWVSGFEKTDRIPTLCTYQLSNSCTSLQKFVFRPFHQPNGLSANHIISQQSECPGHLSVDEFKAMAALPCGFHLQWLNILTQLHMPAVDFTKSDMLQILLQLSRQAGPPGVGGKSRPGHQILSDDKFASAFVDGLELSLKRVKENWETYHALSGFIVLSARILSLSPSAEISLRCLLFLEECRVVAMSWLPLLQEKLKQSENDSTRTEFLGRLLQVAQICAASFDVDEGHLQSVLSTPATAAILIESSIIAQNASHSAPESQNLPRANGLRRILHKVFKFLRKEIVARNSPCLNIALFKSWAAYPGGDGWKKVSKPHGHWLVTSTINQGSSLPLTVHYNLLTGELLVNGFPLSRLPAEYEMHPSYAAFFGKTRLEVLPTDMPGMKFSSKKLHHGLKLFFGMSNTKPNDFFLIASSDTHVYEVIPSRVFAGLLPHKFVNDYVHWYDKGAQTIEFRVKNSPWTPSPSVNWVMREGERGWIMERPGQQVLIGPRTYTARYLSKILAPLEDEKYLHVTLHSKTMRLSVEMPRMQLEFWLDLGSTRLCSRQFRGMFVDCSQRIDTLVGLKSKLVLRNDLDQRKVLVPDGEPGWSPNSLTGHVQVIIPHGASRRVHVYDIDALLQRLMDNGSLQSKLIICHLHALTSSCLPDELIGKTGTEAALTILRSASLRSFEYLKEEDLTKLGRIARLSPDRMYYPKNLMCMESVHWDGRLGFICQDNGFYTSVQSIFAQASATALFYPDSYKDVPRLDYIDSKLEKRHSIRAASFQVCGFGAENYTTDYDVVYQSRDRPSYSERSSRAFKIAHMMARSRESLVESLNHGLVDQIWSSLKGDTQGLTGQMLAQEICYDSSWLGDQADLLQQYWCQLHRFLDGRVTQLNRFQTMLCLSTMAYAKTGCLQLLQVLAAFAKLPNLCRVDVPAGHCFSLHHGRAAVRSDILQVVRLHLKGFFDCPESHISRRGGESEYDLSNRRYNEFTSNQDSAADGFATMVYAQWVCAKPEVLSVDGTHVDASTAIKEIRQKWKFWYDNHSFYNYLRQIVTGLASCSVEASSVPERKMTTLSHLRPREAKPFITTQCLFAFAAPSLPLGEQTQLAQCLPTTMPALTGARLTGLLERLKANVSPKQPYQAKYAAELERSLGCLETQMAPHALSIGEEELREILDENLHQCQLHVDSLYSALQTAIESNLKAQFLNTSSGDIDSWKIPATFMAPRMSPSILLGNLAHTHCESFSSDWKEAIVAYGVAVTKAQRAKRLNQTKLTSDLVKELSNTGHMNWDPLNSPETLLLEIESGILIRDVQEDIALQMREPPDGKNAVMQLNMGEGKSSVIVPIVAAHLADGYRLVRVIVAKPQAKELFRTLASKLGGLLNRRIYHMPFNRMLRLTAQQANSLHELYRECMEQGGILLLQPEHMLSFKLMAIEYHSLADRGSAGTALLDVYNFFETHSRDIVDESDENFSPKFELIYTMGAQRPVELSPERWTVLQRLFGIVASVAPSVKQEFPGSIEITHHRKGRFPRTRVLRADAADLLLRRVTQKICETGLPGLPIARQSDEMRLAVFDYIFERNLRAHQISLVEENTAFFTASVRGPLLLLRGLISGGVLLFALGQKRWRVNYGLDANRQPSTKLAVPYKAKDSPSPRSEFSHPDMVILLTCLTYHYEGLTDDTLFMSFSHLIGSDQADTEYQEWVADSPDLAASFHRLAGVNIKDREQMTRQIFPHVRYAKGAVDYFLSHLVFPKEMKEFSHKLSASGWDFGHQKRHATTGFSGTNDSRHVLPLDVAQLDLEAHRHTNALVLEHLLRPENKVQLLGPICDGEVSDAERLFKFAAATENEVHVILDVGAQILELKNMQAAERWLQMLPPECKQEAVVFFDDDDDICVIDRKGRVERLQTSPYAGQLDRCLVFLDQAHTRGTDLKLPEHYRAAVTLGPDLTKDRLVQACMRMRKLGKGQSVVFCVSEEMHSRITLATGRAPDHDIGVNDVLMWAISETHVDLYRLMPLWAMQGVRFQRQKEVWDEAATSNGIHMSQKHAEELLEEEAQSIEQRYRPVACDTDRDIYSPFGDADLEGSATLRAIQARCGEFGVSDFRSAALQEEQEKELAPEIEQERQIERPAAAQPAPHQIHPDLVHFVATGKLRADSTAFIGAFAALSNTSMADFIKLRQFPDDLLVTADFSRTVKLTRKNVCADLYQRPVQWILTSRSLASQRVIIISPHEAQELMLSIAQSNHVNLHLYSPQANLVFAPLDQLRLYTIPAVAEGWRLAGHLRTQLNLFAGQLYFGSHGDYGDACDMLGLAWRPPSHGMTVEADGFITGGGDGQGRFDKSPVKSIKALLTTLRRECKEIDRTHWGKVIGGEILTEGDFEDEAEGRI